MTRANRFFAVLGRVFLALIVAAWLEGWIERRAGLSRWAESKIAESGGQLSDDQRRSLAWMNFFDRYSYLFGTLPLTGLAIWWGVRSVRREGRSEEGQPRGAAPTDTR
jgi:hypothetical protein